MAKIASTDDLIARHIIAYPGFSETTERIRRFMNEREYAIVYELLSCQVNSGSTLMFSIKEILGTLNESGGINTEKYMRLVAKAQAHAAWRGREPLRQKLAEDFRKTYPDFEPVRWE